MSGREKIHVFNMGKKRIYVREEKRDIAEDDIKNEDNQILITTYAKDNKTKKNKSFAINKSEQLPNITLMELQALAAKELKINPEQYSSAIYIGEKAFKKEKEKETLQNNLKEGDEIRVVFSSHHL